MSACAARENVITSRAAGRPGGRWSFGDDVRRVPSPALLELLVVYSAGRRSTARTAGLSMPQLPTLQTSRRDELTSKCVRRTAPVRPPVRPSLGNKSPSSPPHRNKAAENQPNDCITLTRRWNTVGFGVQSCCACFFNPAQLYTRARRITSNLSL